MQISMKDKNLNLDYINYKRGLRGNKSIGIATKQYHCSHCKSKVLIGDECLFVKNSKGNLRKVFCKECILQVLRLRRASINLENTVYEGDESERNKALVELVKGYLNPVKRSETVHEEDGTIIVSLDDDNYHNVGKSRYHGKGRHRRSNSRI